MKTLCVCLIPALITGCSFNTVVGNWEPGAGAAGGSGTTGGVATTRGASTQGTVGLLPDGKPCTSDDLCESGICGLNGTGNCCTALCRTDEALCAATACDTKGACTYPPGGKPCNSSCQYGLFTGSTCDGDGVCSPQKPVQCPRNLSCNQTGTACEGTCNPAKGAADCSLGWYCASGAGGGVCTPQVSLGPCVSNAECTSNVCGVTGTGHCCTQTPCTNTSAPCGTTDCDNDTGECTFGSPTTSCDTGPITCLPDNQTEANPNTTCDGVGNCAPPITTDCSPYACETVNGVAACVGTCSTTADCAKDFYCLDGQCVPQSAIGPCTENDACISLQCGRNGTGNCCVSSCPSTDPTECGVTDCDADGGACIYPSGPSAPCNSDLGGHGGLPPGPGVCDGKGNCSGA